MLFFLNMKIYNILLLLIYASLLGFLEKYMFCLLYIYFFISFTYMHFHLCAPSDLLFRIFPAADDDDDQYDNKSYGSDTDADYWTNYWAAVAIQSGPAATKSTVLQVPVYISGAVDSSGTCVTLFCI